INLIQPLRGRDLDLPDLVAEGDDVRPRLRPERDHRHGCCGIPRRQEGACNLTHTHRAADVEPDQVVGTCRHNRFERKMESAVEGVDNVLVGRPDDGLTPTMLSRERAATRGINGTFGATHNFLWLLDKRLRIWYV